MNPAEAIVLYATALVQIAGLGVVLGLAASVVWILRNRK